MQKPIVYGYENGTGSQMMKLELETNGHFSICLEKNKTGINSCRHCHIIENVYRMGYNNGWQEAHETWETQ